MSHRTPKTISTRRKPMVLAVLALTLVAAACSGSDVAAVDRVGDGSAAPAAPPAPETPDLDEAATTTDEGDADTLEVLSGRPEFVIGGNVLVRYDGGEDPSFAVDGEPLSADLRSSEADGDVYLLDGLGEGTSTIEAGGTSVEVTAHPTVGPVFSGPHQEPFYCALDRAELTPTGDEFCSARTEVYWVNLDEDGEATRFDPDGEPTREDFAAGGLVVRVERGTINRGIYTFTVADPSVGAAPIEPGKDLIYAFGGGCGTGHSQASALELGVDSLDREALEAGYVLATSTLNVFQAHCNDVLSAETLMMTLEHVAETVGPLGLTIGRGGSGGAIQQYLIAQNYPGLLDAMHALVSFPDAATIAPGVSDCGLLLDYFESDAGAGFDEAQRKAIQGHGTAAFCDAWKQTFVGNISPVVGCDGAVPETEVYEPDTNPDGIRCTLQDSAKNVFGTDDNGFGRRALDNVGVQYGLGALEAGAIDVDAFLDLNEAIGGYDIDGRIVPGERTAADPEVIEVAYSTGRVLDGQSAIRDLPIIDVDLYSDLGYDIHDRFRLFTIRARMASADGSNSGNRVIWSRPGEGLLGSLGGDEAEAAPTAQAETPTGTEIADILTEWARTGERPEGVADDCVIGAERIVGDDIFGEGSPCGQAYPYFGDPRTTAGAPLVNDIIKCQTTAVDPTSYVVPFDESQAERLANVFADGVCDWSVTGVGQVPLSGTWLEY